MGRSLPAVAAEARFVLPAVVGASGAYASLRVCLLYGRGGRRAGRSFHLQSKFRTPETLALERLLDYVNAIVPLASRHGRGGASGSSDSFGPSVACRERIR